MDKLFLIVLNLSLAGSYAIFAVLIARLLLAKAPKRWRYLLWAAVAFRLAIPFSFSSRFSLLNLTTLKVAGARVEYIPADIGYQAAPTVELGSTALNQAVNTTLPAATPYASMNPIQFWLYLGQWLWLAGIGALLLYNVASLVWLRHGLNETSHSRENIWYGSQVGQPFVLGWLRPRIYLPTGMEPDAEEIVLSHERYHIRRGDHWVKLLGFCLLVVHWFNPLCWLAFRLMTRDMEMSCDEAVLAEQSVSPKAYSNTLLGLAAIKAMPMPGALHFGESDISSRIRNSLCWKKPVWWVTAGTAVAAVVFLLSVTANPTAQATTDFVVPSPGRFVMGSDVLCPPRIVLEEDGQFQYPYSAFLSSYPQGAYIQEGSVLTCTTEDGQYVLRFEIVDEDTLVYLAEGSTHPKVISESIDAVVEDGARFLRQEEFPSLTQPEPEEQPQPEYTALPVEQPEPGASTEAAIQAELPLPSEAPALMGIPLEDFSHVSHRFGDEHKGTDFSAAAGTPVYAVADGTVLLSRYHYSYGNYVSLEHTQPYDGQSVRTLYGHMNELAVEAGQTVKQGDVLGYVGATGAATGNCLHLEITLDGQRAEPLDYVSLPHEIRYTEAPAQ